MNDSEPLIVRIPADVARPDKIAYGFTARQLVILSVTGGIASSIYYVFRQVVPVVVIAAVALPLVALGAALALGRRDGLTLDRFALAAVLFLRSPKKVVAAPDGVVPPPRWCRLCGKLPAPLCLPVRAVRSDGALELADGGTAALVETSTLSFHLRTADEQASLVGAFGRWLNSLDASVQILVRARPVDLAGVVYAIEEQAGRLQHPALARAAAEHAGFLGRLNASRDLLARQVLVVVRDPHPPRGRRATVRDASAAVVLRHAAETQRALAALGVTTAVLDADAASRVLIECLDPGGWHPSGTALVDELITGLEVQ
ncbi:MULTISPECIES: PrgI family protein [Microbispora]|uniref:PrgI family protein n=3 Tax=Microbispora TaxID=2005 RepID=A0ABY3LSL2_9ACTN|nr:MULTISPECIES: PrgI family protein [Microbispora]KAA9375978.1 PrgI family protein [Microbispora cellulosiformans]TLP57868.1 PrgI family protein [Microbispora fusca]TYB52336.1 PrgI family protein [Microbispora tritici]